MDTIETAILAHVREHARDYGAHLHGADASGLIDLEFPTVAEGAAFTTNVLPVARPRDPVTDLTGSVVLQFTVADWFRAWFVARDAV